MLVPSCSLSSYDLNSYGDKNVCKDLSTNRSSYSLHRSFYYKSENARKGLISLSLSSTSSFRFDFDGFIWSKGFYRYRESGESRALIHRREFPKGFWSERDRSRRQGSVSSWRRGLKDFDERVVQSPKGLRDVNSPTLMMQ